MTLIRRTSPIGELLSLRQAMDRLMEDSFVRPKSGLTADEHPLALDLYTTPEALVVEAALPGVKPEDVNVSLLGDQLTISATSREDRSSDEDGHSYREIRRGSFSRSVTLPTGIDADGARASFDNGLLRLHIPRAEEAKARQIPVTSQPIDAGQPADARSTNARSTNEES